VLRDVLDRIAGYGPLQRWLDDPEVEEIWVNEPMKVNAQLSDSVMALGPQ
jgi:pilus assembly protein CpaF